MELQGKIKLVKETVAVTDSFRKRELIITTNEQYPQDISIEFAQDKTDVLNGYSKGDDVTVGINIRGREWINPEGVAKYFNSIQGWKITKQGGGGESPQTPREDDGEDLPF